MTIGAGMLAFSLAGLGFEEAMVLTIAGLSTTGPIAAVALEDPIRLNELGLMAKMAFAVMMIVGRLEILAIIALLNPAFWR